MSEEVSIVVETDPVVAATVVGDPVVSATAADDEAAVLIVREGLPGPPGLPSPQYVGAWSPAVTYQIDDLVTAGGDTWIAIEPSTGVDPAADASHSPVASMTPTSPLALGSPQAVSMGFRVDRTTTALAMNMLAAWQGGSGGEVGIASAINVPGVGVQWMGKGPIQMPAGRIDLDVPVTLNVGVDYWLTMIMPSANVQIDQGGDLTPNHMSWTGEFWYGSSAPSNDFKIYGLGVILFGSTTDDPWQLFLAGGEPGPQGPKGDTGDKGAKGDTGAASTVPGPQGPPGPQGWQIMTQAEYDALPVKDPAVVYVIA